MRALLAVVAFVFVSSSVIIGCLAQLNGPNRAQTIGNIFQIPIQTLTAISNVAQNTRPVGEILQRRRRPSQQRFPAQQSFTPQISRAARVAGLYPAADGSFFRI